MQYKDTYEGLRVLLTYPNKRYTIGRSNPAVGTRWQCGGVIHHLFEDHSIGVEWDNGASNVYTASDLSCEKDVMNFAGHCVSIW